MTVQARWYLNALAAAIEADSGVPILIVYQSPSGPAIAIAADFPEQGLPTREQWGRLFPGDLKFCPPTVSIRVTPDAMDEKGN